MSRIGGTTEDGYEVHFQVHYLGWKCTHLVDFQVNDIGWECTHYTFSLFFQVHNLSLKRIL